MHQIHDRGYKKLFSNRIIFRQLIETFVRQNWVKELDFTDCETLDKTFIADHYKETESDIIYKVKFKGRDAYLVILLEFQSAVDRFMVLRVLNYLTNFYMDYVQSFEDVTMLPPVFPVVLYNGDRPWTAPIAMSDIIENHAILGRFAPLFEYWPIVERAYALDELLNIRNIVSTLFLAEAHYDLEMLKHELVALFPHENQQAVSLLINWFLQLKVHGRLDPAHYDELERVYHDAQEVHAMLETALARERQQWREQYREEIRREVSEEVRREVSEEVRREVSEEEREKGELIGAIRTLQMVLRRPISEKDALQEHKIEDLQKVRQELETALKNSPLMS